MFCVCSGRMKIRSIRRESFRRASQVCSNRIDLSVAWLPGVSNVSIVSTNPNTKARRTPLSNIPHEFAEATSKSGAAVSGKAARGRSALGALDLRNLISPSHPILVQIHTRRDTPIHQFSGYPLIVARLRKLCLKGERRSF